MPSVFKAVVSSAYLVNWSDLGATMIKYVEH